MQQHRWLRQNVDAIAPAAAFASPEWVIGNLLMRLNRLGNRDPPLRLFLDEVYEIVLGALRGATRTASAFHSTGLVRVYFFVVTRMTRTGSVHCWLVV